MSTLYRGDDTDAFGSSFITINLATSISGTISEAVMDGETVVAPAVTEEVETNVFADAVDCYRV